MALIYEGPDGPIEFPVSVKAPTFQERKSDPNNFFIFILRKLKFELFQIHVDHVVIEVCNV